MWSARRTRSCSATESLGRTSRLTKSTFARWSSQTLQIPRSLQSGNNGGGVVERGAPQTLVLTKLDCLRTKPRAPGPGPIRKSDWTPFAKKRLQDRKVILHTDGAKAYMVKVPGVIHDRVIHMKKKTTVKGKVVWVSPKYVQLFTHTLPGGKKIRVKGGTQIIDRFWSQLRTYMGKSPGKPGSVALRRRVRSAQWAYWNKGADHWLKTGEMLQALHMRR